MANLCCGSYAQLSGGDRACPLNVDTVLGHLDDGICICVGRSCKEEQQGVQRYAKTANNYGTLHIDPNGISHHGLEDNHVSMHQRHKQG